MERLRTCTRPIVTLVVAGVVCAGFLLGRISADQFMPIASTVVLFWFSDRAGKGSRS